MSTSDIWDNYRLQLFNYIRRQVQDAHDAKDILQDVFIKAQTRRDEIKDFSRLAGWMFSITRNAIADHYRKIKKDKRITEHATVNEIQPDHSYNNCVATCLQQLMYTLPEPYRDALIKADVENIPQTELASALGLSHSGAKSRVQRARKMLKDKLTDLYKIETDRYGNVIVCEDKVPCACNPDIFQ